MMACGRVDPSGARDEGGRARGRRRDGVHDSCAPCHASDAKGGGPYPDRSEHFSQGSLPTLTNQQIADVIM